MTFGMQIFLPLGLVAWLYVLGVGRVRRRRATSAWSTARSVSFLAGIGVVFVALQWPIDTYSDVLLSVHMVQHLLLTLIAPPLLLLGRPMTLAYAASSGGTRARLHRIVRSRWMRALSSPGVGFAAFAVVMWASHFSSLYEAALTNQALHACEHVAYLTTALLFWWPVVARDPGSARLSHPARVLYLFMSMPVMSLLGFVISSDSRVLYPHYAVSSLAFGTSALADQRLGGTIMWEASMLVSAVALSAVLLDWMRSDELAATRADLRRDRRRDREPGAIARAEGT